MAGGVDGRKVVVTGAGRGIGAAIAAAFRETGDRVVGIDLPGTDGCVPADLADPPQVRAAMGDAIGELGGIDVLVNNAGILRIAPLLEIAVEDWDAVFAVNARAMLLTTQVAAAAMIAAGRGGRIVNMASMGGKLGAPGQAHYAASKAAVISLTQVAAQELGAHGITVNCICPGYVLTEMGAATRTADKVAAWTAKSPLGRLGTVEDVAAMALFLASDRAAYCTGQAMNVTGGMIMH